MSATDPTLAELVADFESLTIGNKWEIAALAFVVFDYLITFGQEVNLFWTRKFTGASLLLLSNRYLVILLYTMNISGSGSLSVSEKGYAVYTYTLYMRPHVLTSVPPSSSSSLVKTRT